MEKEFNPDDKISQTEGTEEAASVEQITVPSEVQKEPETIKKPVIIEKKFKLDCSNIHDPITPQCNFMTETGCPDGCDQFEKREPPADVPLATINALRAILKNPEQVYKRELSPDTCQKIIEIITDLMDNNGILLDGITTFDGMTMAPCPKYGYSPISLCMEKCDKFVGHDISGKCIATESEIHGYVKFTHLEARQKEIQMRKDQEIRKAKELREIEETARQKIQEGKFEL